MEIQALSLVQENPLYLPKLCVGFLSEAFGNRKLFVCLIFVTSQRHNISSQFYSHGGSKLNWSVKDVLMRSDIRSEPARHMRDHWRG